MSIAAPGSHDVGLVVDRTIPVALPACGTVREVADRTRINAFMAALARHATADVDVFLVRGPSAVLVGWRDTTIDVGLVMRPDSDATLRSRC